MSDKKPSANEEIKAHSNFLRGTIAEGLVDTTTGAMPAADHRATSSTSMRKKRLKNRK